MYTMSRFISACVLLVLPASYRAAVTLPGWFGDNMVVQTNAEYGARAVLSGRASPSEQVTVNVTMPGKSPQLFAISAVTITLFLYFVFLVLRHRILSVCMCVSLSLSLSLSLPLSLLCRTTKAIGLFN